MHDRQTGDHDTGRGSSGSHDKHEGHSPEMFRDRLLISVLLTVPILYFSTSIQDWFGFEAIAFTGSELVTPILSTILYFYGGGPFLKGSLRELQARTPGMMTLIAIAITVAYGYSIAVTLGFPGDPFYWELATLIDIMLLGHWMEMRSVRSASSALDELSTLVPDTAHLLRPDGSTSEVEVASLEVGDRVVVRPGEQVPIDSVVIEGRTFVNEAFLTGESKPVGKEPGSEMVGGSINGEGVVTIEVSRVGDDTALSQIMRLVDEAQTSRSRYQALADRAAFWLTVIAIGVAVPTLLIWLAIDDDPTFAVTRMVTVLVIACPHALGLAIPLVTANATRMAAQTGVLVRNREAFERGRDIQLVAFDKTGTLTEGTFGISAVASVVDDDEALRIAGALEQNSEHPIAAAITEAAAELEGEAVTATEVRAVAGEGITGTVDGVEWSLGKPEWIDANLEALDERLRDVLAEADQRGDSPVALGRGGQVVAVITLADKVRAQARDAIAELMEMGIRPVMITGDAEAVARTVASELGIDRYFARVRPDEKARIVRDLHREGRVAFVGDGINDAPALLEADLGVAIGAGTNVALESADLVLVDDDPLGVARALRLSRLTRSKMVQNLVWATGYNVVAIPLAAGVGISAGIVMSPAVGAILMSVSTIVVAVNAMTMRRASLG
ncbi:MAG TPA: heavy metal translocating P-type ATPase [Acidimicrobiia bacterium]|nr:heavy metal translocating P-type ATPase [Acidimicrobiia bacterium]